jgi:hypothetical protein
MIGLLKFVSFCATSFLFLNGLGAIDLAAWGGESFKDHLETVNNGKEIVTSVAEVVSGHKLSNEHSVAVQAAVAAPGVTLALAGGLISLIKFLIGVCFFAALLALAFIFVQQNQVAIENWRDNLQPDMVPGQPWANLGTVFSHAMGPVIVHPPPFPPRAEGNGVPRVPFVEPRYAPAEPRYAPREERCRPPRC